MLNYLLKKTGLKSENPENTSQEATNMGEASSTTQTQINKATQTEASTQDQALERPYGTRVSGKQWKETKKPMRIKHIGIAKSSWNKKRQQQLEMKTTKAKEKELKDEKEQEKRDRIQKIKDRRAAKEEKERYARLAEKMHAKRVARMRKREKRNKLLKDR
jgi:rRNA-processing protein CGR1